MFANERQKIILHLISTQESVTVSELMKRLEVSTETIRRDLESLEKEHKLKRVHGGAISIAPKNSSEKLEQRFAKNSDLKNELAKTAMQFIEEGDTIAIDSGTTAVAFAIQLKQHFQSLTIITFSVEVFTILSDMPGYKIIVTGGEYSPEEKVFSGFLSNEAMEKFHFAKSFVVPSAISLTYGVYDFIHQVYQNQKLLIQNASKVFLLADSTKFEKVGNLKLCDLFPAYTLITDNNLPDSVCEQYLAKGLSLVRY